MPVVLKKYIVVVSFFLFLPLNSGIFACNTGTVRDAAFYGERTIYRLAVVSEDHESSQAADCTELMRWIALEGTGLNLHGEIVDPGDTLHLKQHYGIAVAPPILPIALLAAFHPASGEPRIFMTDTPASILAMLQSLESGPFWAGLKQDLKSYWAVVLYSQGTSRLGGMDMISLESRWRVTRSPGIKTLALDPNRAEHALLIALLGMETQARSWIAVLYGRARLMLPILAGDSVRENQLESMLDRLAQPCTCVQQAENTALDLPFFWEDTIVPEFAALAPVSAYSEISLDQAVAKVMEEAPQESRLLEQLGIYALILIGALSALLCGTAWIRSKTQREP